MVTTTQNYSCTENALGSYSLWMAVGEQWTLDTGQRIYATLRHSHSTMNTYILNTYYLWMTKNMREDNSRYIYIYVVHILLNSTSSIILLKSIKIHWKRTKTVAHLRHLPLGLWVVIIIIIIKIIIMISMGSGMFMTLFSMTKLHLSTMFTEKKKNLYLYIMKRRSRD